jgi:HlyD family secretion protein
MIGLIVFMNIKRNAQSGGGVPVEMGQVLKKDLSLELSTKGIVEAREETRVKSEIPGTIEEVHVRVGDEVKRGDLLVSFDVSDLLMKRREAERLLREAESNLALLKRRKENTAAVNQAELEQARAQLEQVRLRTKKTEGLPPWEDARILALEELREAEARVNVIEARVESDKVIDEEIAAASAYVSSSQAALADAEAAISKSVIKSSVDGLVTDLTCEPGDRVAEGAFLLEISDLTSLCVRTKVDEVDVGHLKIGAQAKIMSKAYPGAVFTGAVAEVAPKATRDGNTGYFDVVINPTTSSWTAGEAWLRPGMSVDANILAEEKSDIIVIPSEAVLTKYELSSNRRVDKRDGDGDENGSSEPASGRDVTGLDDLDQAFVFVEEESIARLREVRLGMDTTTEVEVLDGLSAGEVLILGDYETLRKLEDGDKVKPKKM